jgi:hypothetical protein
MSTMYYTGTAEDVVLKLKLERYLIDRHLTVHCRKFTPFYRYSHAAKAFLILYRLSILICGVF